MPSGYGLYLKSDYEGLIKSRFVSFTGEIVSKKFIEKLKEKRDEIDALLVEKMIFTEKEEFNFKNTKNCYLCGKEFLCEEQKVRDHDHFTAKF